MFSPGAISNPHLGVGLPQMYGFSSGLPSFQSTNGSTGCSRISRNLAFQMSPTLRPVASSLSPLNSSSSCLERWPHLLAPQHVINDQKSLMHELSKSSYKNLQSVLPSIQNPLSYLSAQNFTFPQLLGGLLLKHPNYFSMEYVKLVEATLQRQKLLSKQPTRSENTAVLSTSNGSERSAV